MHKINFLTSCIERMRCDIRVEDFERYLATSCRYALSVDSWRNGRCAYAYIIMYSDWFVNSLDTLHAWSQCTFSARNTTSNNITSTAKIAAILEQYYTLLKILYFWGSVVLCVLLAKNALRSSVKSRAYSISQYRYCFDGKIIIISSIVAFSSCSLRCQKYCWLRSCILIWIMTILTNTIFENLSSTRHIINGEAKRSRQSSDFFLFSWNTARSANGKYTTRDVASQWDSQGHLPNFSYSTASVRRCTSQ